MKWQDFRVSKTNVLLSLGRYLSQEQSFRMDSWELFPSFFKWTNEVKKLTKILLKAKFRIFSFSLINKDNMHSLPKGFMVCFTSVFTLILNSGYQSHKVKVILKSYLQKYSSDHWGYSLWAQFTIKYNFKAMVKSFFFKGKCGETNVYRKQNF